jgi:signal peptidase II
MRNIATRLIVLVALVGTIGCDRVSKRIATEVLADAPGRSFLADTVRLDYAENTGAFPSLGAILVVLSPAWRRTSQQLP